MSPSPKSNSISSLTRFLMLLAVVAFLPAYGENWFVPGKVVVEFEPNVIGLPPNPGRKVIPLKDVPINIPGLRSSIESVGIVEFEIIALPWRWIESEPYPEDHVPPRLKSFRDIYHLHFPEYIEVASVVDTLSGLPGIKLVAPSALISPLVESYFPPDEYFLECEEEACDRPYQWNLHNTGDTINSIACTDDVDINMPEAWGRQLECSVKIGFTDFGCDEDHPDLVTNIDTDLARNFVPDGQGDLDSLAWNDDHGHGTKVAGVLGAVHSPDSLGVAGICGVPSVGNSVLVPLKVLGGSGDPDYVAGILEDAIAYAAGHYPEIPVLSMSVAMEDGPDGVKDSLWVLRNAIYNAHHTGLTLVAGAGNLRSPDPSVLKMYPAAFFHMTTGVAALGCDASREQDYWSEKWIDISAPGQADDSIQGGATARQIVTTDKDGLYTGIDNGFFGGTSAATPHVSGAAALLLSRNSALTNEDVHELLIRTAKDYGDSGYDFDYGHGLLRVDSALTVLDTFHLVHDSTSVVNFYFVKEACRLQKFKNIPFLSDPEPEAYKTFYADLYEFRSSVSLPQNTNPNHVPEIWVRGRQSIAARDTTKYDGFFQPYTGDVVYVSSSLAVLRGYTYKIYSDAACDTFVRWYPLTLPYSGNSTVFSYTYLADTTASNAAHQGPVVAPLAVNPRHALIVGERPARVKFYAPDGSVGELKIYDVRGRLVRRLSLPSSHPGWREEPWDGRDRNGHRLSSGVYFGRMEVGRNVGKVRFLVIC